MRRLVIALLSVVALAGCGLRGGLERAPPMFGAEKARYEAEQRRKADEEAAAKTAQAEQSGRQTVEIPTAAPKPAETAAPQTLQLAPQASPFRPN
jgi:predicted small lipoprotein YifL